MTVKEVEARSGMTRANIRFYEAEGLLSPTRAANGYREYSEQDVEVLKRIKLLRALHISLEEIQKLQTGEDELVKALDRHLARLTLEQKSIERAQDVCQTMRSDGVRYETLDAQRYLDDLERGPVKPLPVPPEDTIPKVYSPWRRFFARSFDFAVYNFLWTVFLVLVCNVNLSSRGAGGNILDTCVALLLTLFLEPALLSLFGTTPGKWLLGLRVTADGERRLSYGEAFSRTWTVLWSGLGLQIPFYSWYRLWKNYKACKEWEPLDWEWDSVLSLKDERPWRAAALTVGYAALFGVLFVVISAGGMPKHRGDLTVAQFCDNYNRLADYYDIGSSRLDSTGAWVEEPGVYVVSLDALPSDPIFTFTEEDGIMTGMSFSAELDNSTDWIMTSYQTQMALAVLSFVSAQQRYSPFSGVDDMVKQIQSHPYESFQFTKYGVSVTCQVAYSGYMSTGSSTGFLIPEDSPNAANRENTEQQPVETSYSFSFVMEREASE